MWRKNPPDTLAVPPIEPPIRSTILGCDLVRFHLFTKKSLQLLEEAAKKRKKRSDNLVIENNNQFPLISFLIIHFKFEKETGKQLSTTTNAMQTQRATDSTLSSSLDRWLHSYTLVSWMYVVLVLDNNK